jgi:ribosomal protein S12 methylthiotransferase accessory factor
VSTSSSISSTAVVSSRIAAPHRDLRSARVIVVGLEPWGSVAAADLASAGVGALHLVDDRKVTLDDLSAVRLFTEADRGEPRIAALSAAIARVAPSCRVTTATLEASADAPLSLGSAPADLILAGVPGDDLLVLSAVARAAEATRTPSIAAHLDGLDAMIGPGVVPGKTACWNCWRLRRLAISAHAADDHALQASLLAERPGARARMYAAPMPALAGHALARAALDMLADRESAPIAGHLLVQNLVTLAVTRHAALRMPRCPVCGGAARAFPNGAPPEGSGKNLDQARNPADLRRMLAGVVDARAGVVHQLFLQPPEISRDPELPLTATARLSRYTEGALRAHCCEPDSGAGKGTTAVNALISAVGEAVERYSAARFDPASLLRRSVAEMTGDFIAPADLCPYADHQHAQEGFPFVKLDPKTPIEWVRAAWLDTGAPVMVPALPTYMHYPASRKAYFCEVTSNGLAAGPTLEQASLSAALELIERDAFMIAWLARRPGILVKPDTSIDPAAREAARQLEAAGLRIALYLLDAGTGIPTIACVGYGDGDRWPGAMLSIAAHLRPSVAITKAILEQGHLGPYLRRLVHEEKTHIPEHPEEVTDLEHHALYYFPAHRAGALAFLGAGGTVDAANLPEPEEVSIRALCRRVSAAGLRIAVADVTSPDLAETPFRVARALGPGFQQIHFGHGLARLGNPRLVAMTPAGTNPEPHPMA